ncbi:Neurensin-1 [Blomia tropicalis]|nr:Neurensin-1 [Blomia tropicalis]
MESSPVKNKETNPNETIVGGIDEEIDDFDEHPTKAKYFGIKSYLHNFYENVSSRGGGGFDEFDDDGMVVNHITMKDANRRRRSTLWLTTIIAGALSLFCGAILLVAGFTFPKMKIDIGYQEEMRIIDKSAFEFNEHLDQFKIIGLAMFAIGGTLVASALLLPSLLSTSNYDDGDEDERSPFKLRINENDAGLISENKNLIPITEQVKTVQPKQEKQASIITNAGLKQFAVD